MDAAQTFAPCLLFSRYEGHLPGTPEFFRQYARFRQSNFEGRRDRGWNRRTGQWEASNKHGPDYLGTDWSTILDVIRLETESLRPGGPHWDGKVTRPRDERNLWRDEDRVRGFFLELKEGYGRERSGGEPDTPGYIYHDTHTIRVDGLEYVALFFWFFYIYNWHIFFAHEGDWEHITLYFRREAFYSGGRPQFVFFAAHNKGLFLPASHPSITWIEETHPKVYVSHWGHPSYPAVPAHRRTEYTIRWETWKHGEIPAEIPAVEKQPWALYDGAWGEIGDWVHSTGPLGPIFKRRWDRVALTRRRQ